MNVWLFQSSRKRMLFSRWPLSLPSVDSAEGPRARAALIVVSEAGRVLVSSAPLASLLLLAQLFDSTVTASASTAAGTLLPTVLKSPWMYAGFWVATVSPCEGSWAPLTRRTAAPGVFVEATYMTPLAGAVPEVRRSPTSISVALIIWFSRPS